MWRGAARGNASRFTRGDVYIPCYVAIALHPPHAFRGPAAAKPPPGHGKREGGHLGLAAKVRLPRGHHMRRGKMLHSVALRGKRRNKLSPLPPCQFLRSTPTLQHPRATHGGQSQESHQVGQRTTGNRFTTSRQRGAAAMQCFAGHGMPRFTAYSSASYGALSTSDSRAEISGRPFIRAPALPSVLTTGPRSSTDGKAGARMWTAVCELRNWCWTGPSWAVTARSATVSLPVPFGSARRIRAGGHWSTHPV